MKAKSKPRVKLLVATKTYSNNIYGPSISSEKDTLESQTSRRHLKQREYRQRATRVAPYVSRKQLIPLASVIFQPSATLVGGLLSLPPPPPPRLPPRPPAPGLYTPRGLALYLFHVLP